LTDKDIEEIERRYQACLSFSLSLNEYAQALSKCRDDVPVLLVEIKRQREAVSKYLLAKKQDLYHENKKELASAFGLGELKLELVSEEEFRRMCDEYAKEVYGYECLFDED
jgi:uncharacterized protein YqeY